ncbi:MAG: hypothetical protein AAGI53_09430 [Planctomycetota bacterium]
MSCPLLVDSEGFLLVASSASPDGGPISEDAAACCGSIDPEPPEPCLCSPFDWDAYRPEIEPPGFPFEVFPAGRVDLGTTFSCRIAWSISDQGRSFRHDSNSGFFDEQTFDAVSAASGAVEISFRRAFWPIVNGEPPDANRIEVHESEGILEYIVIEGVSGSYSASRRTVFTATQNDPGLDPSFTEEFEQTETGFAVGASGGLWLRDVLIDGRRCVQVGPNVVGGPSVAFDVTGGVPFSAGPIGAGFTSNPDIDVVSIDLGVPSGEYRRTFRDRSIVGRVSGEYVSTDVVYRSVSYSKTDSGSFAFIESSTNVRTGSVVWSPGPGCSGIDLGSPLIPPIEAVEVIRCTDGAFLGYVPRLLRESAGPLQGLFTPLNECARFGSNVDLPEPPVGGFARVWAGYVSCEACLLDGLPMRAIACDGSGDEIYISSPLATALWGRPGSPVPPSPVFRSFDNRCWTLTGERVEAPADVEPINRSAATMADCSLCLGASRRLRKCDNPAIFVDVAPSLLFAKPAGTVLVDTAGEWWYDSAQEGDGVEPFELAAYRASCDDRDEPVVLFETCDPMVSGGSYPLRFVVPLSRLAPFAGAAADDFIGPGLAFDPDVDLILVDAALTCSPSVIERTQLCARMVEGPIVDAGNVDRIDTVVAILERTDCDSPVCVQDAACPTGPPEPGGTGPFGPQQRVAGDPRTGVPAVGVDSGTTGFGGVSTAEILGP